MNDAGVVQAAKMVRPYLSDLIGDERADDWDQRLGELLSRDVAETRMAVDLWQVLEKDETVLQWVEDVLDDPALLPPELQRLNVRGAGYAPVPGQGEPIQFDRFVCPVDGDVIWYRPRIGVPILRCNTHDRELVRG